MKESSKITASELVLSAIFSLRQKNGVTAKEITKYICDKRGLKQSKIRENVRNALERATDNGIFSKKRGLYRIETKPKEDSQMSDRKGKRAVSKMKKPEEEPEEVGEPMQCDPSPSVCALESPKFVCLNQTLTMKKSPDFAGSSGMTGSHVDDKTSSEIEKVYYIPTFSNKQEEDDDDEDFLEDDDDDDEDFFEDDTFIKSNESFIISESQVHYQEEGSRKRKMEENSNNFIFSVESSGTDVGQNVKEKKVYGDYSDDEIEVDVCEGKSRNNKKTPKGKKIKRVEKEEKRNKRQKRRKGVTSDENVDEKETKEATEKELKEEKNDGKGDAVNENAKDVNNNDAEDTTNCECDDCRSDKTDKTDKTEKTDKSEKSEEEDKDEDEICDDYYEENEESFLDENDEEVQGDDCDDGNPDSDGQSQDSTDSKNEKKDSKGQGGKNKDDKKQRENKTKEEGLNKPQESGQEDKDKGAEDPKVPKGKTPVPVVQPVPTSKAPVVSHGSPDSDQEKNCWKRRNLTEFSAKNKNSCSTRKMSNISRRHKSCLGSNATSR